MSEKIGEPTQKTGRLWWGKPEVVTPRPVIEYRFRKARSFFNMPGRFNIGPYTYASWVYRVIDAVRRGCMAGVEYFIDNDLRVIPSRTGALRTDVAYSLRSSAWEIERATSLPVIVRVGAPTTLYAPIVHRYRKGLVQVRHRGGTVRSGRRRRYKYKSGTGDPGAHYRFFYSVARRTVASVNLAVREFVYLEGVPLQFFDWLVYTKVHRWRL